MRPPDPGNEHDIQLLRDNPHALVVKYQPALVGIVRELAIRGTIPFTDVDDIVQEVNSRLIERMPKIQASFQGACLLRTYLSLVERRICIDILKHRSAVPRFEELRPEHLESPDPGLGRLFVEHEVLAFRAILEQFGSKLPKLLLSLKLRYRIPLTASEILALDPDCPRSELSTVLDTFGGTYEHLQEREIHERIAPFLNRVEGKSNSPDALRKWTALQIKELIALLNGPSPGAQHTEETLEILFDDYLFPFLLR